MRRVRGKERSARQCEMRDRETIIQYYLWYSPRQYWILDRKNWLFGGFLVVFGHIWRKDGVCLGDLWQSCPQMGISPEFGNYLRGFLGRFQSCHRSIVHLSKNSGVFQELF